MGVIDSGISYHSDLNDNYSYEDALDFYNITTIEPTLGKGDSSSHGTHVAGIIGAVGDNEIGISGVNWNVSLVQMRATHAPNIMIAIINALKYASEIWDTNKRIHIINFSLGFSSPSELLENAIRDYCNKGGLFICATGNTPQDNDVVHYYPAYYGSSLYGDPIPNIITVGRIDINNERPIGANWGINSIMIYAPGENILSTTPDNICIENDNIVNTSFGDKHACECQRQFDQWIYVSEHKSNGYHYFSGSSMSTPYVTGVAALLLSVNPNLTSAQIKNCILNGSDTITIVTGDGDNQSVKSLNAWGAFKYLMENYPLYEQNVQFVNSTYTQSIDADALYMKDNTSIMKLNIDNQGEYSFTVTSESSLEIKFYDANLQEINISQIKQNDDKEINFIYNVSYPSTFYLRSNYSNGGEGPLHVHLKNLSHTHSYIYYTYVNATTHRSECGCGAWSGTTAPHAFVPYKYSINQVICAGCKYIKSLGNGSGNIIMSIDKVSANGSYILPDGTIMLVEEDIEAYFNGTLVFYDKGNVPQTQ
ncbi:MAG: S8 family serine peptidase [Clostridia bacterium]|nr:S8 family serine peptidase [Clostridia bacterium]